MSLIKMFFGGAWRFIRSAQRAFGTLLFIGFVYLLVMITFSDDTPSIPKGAALVFNPTGMVVEQERQKDRLEIIFEDESSSPPEVRLRDIARVLKLAKTDNRISSLILDISYLQTTGPANAHYIAQLIEDFKASGKPVLAYGDNFGQTEYFLASHADEIYLNPAGNILLTGFGIYPTYYKEGLDKLGVEVNVFRVGEYKSAVDGFMFNEMPDASRLSNGQLISSLWQTYLNWVSAGREFEEGALQEKLVNLSADLTKTDGNLANLALNQGLVDALLTHEQWRKTVAEKVGLNEDEDDFLQVDFYDYLAAHANGNGNHGSNQVGIIIVEGTILDGEQPAGTAGGDTVARHLREARLDDDVKAVVMRVNSPGGSSFASERIRREVDLIKAAGKPVVVSMGSYAASGGYWVSANADEIFAMPSTITGSIGIFAVIPTFSKALETIGVRVDGIGTTPLSSGFNLGMPMSEPVHDLLSQSVNNGYQQFLNLVSEGRGLDIDHVDTIAQGRVWSGAYAITNGLVDKLGTIDDAIASAAERAGLKSYSTSYISDGEPFGDKLFEMLFSKTQPLTAVRARYNPSSAQLYLGQVYRDARHLISLNDPQNLYTLCLTCRVQ